MKNIVKNFTTFEIVNVIAYVEKFMSEDMKKALGLKPRYYFDKNVKKISGIARDFEEYRDKTIKELQSEYFDDTHSTIFYETVKDENGEPIKNKDGSEQTQEMRKVKPEYMNDYEEKVKEINGKLSELLLDRNSVELYCIDMDEFVENLPDDTPIDFDCLNILSFMDLTTNVEGE